MSDTHTTTYDAVAYEGQPFRRAHPDAISQVAMLFGMQPQSLHGARVLELGCGDGANIIPMAAALPKSSFVGVDIAPQAIALGLSTVRTLKLPNIILRQMSVTEIGDSFGEFDFIIAHGLYSWVGPEVQRGIMKVIQERLTPNGLAYISYNTLPGWHFRGLARELMNFHALRYQGDPSLFISQSRAILEFVAKNVTNRDPLYAKAIQDQFRTISALPDWYVFHDYLETHNEALYFSEFNRRAEEYGLQYVGDTEFSKLVPQEFPVATQELLGRFAGDFVAFEQYCDFLRNRMFRRTVLCRKEISLQRNIDGHWLEGCSIATPARFAQLPNVSTPVLLHPNGGRIQTENAPLNAALAKISQAWPRAVSFRELIPEAQRYFSLGETADPGFRNQVRTLAAGLLKLLFAELIEVRTVDYPVVNALSERPLAFAPARLSAERGGSFPSVLHDALGVSPEEREILKNLDGNHTKMDLFRVLQIHEMQTGVRKTDGERANLIDQTLERFRREAILVG